MKKQTKILASVMALTMLAGTTAACGGGGNNGGKKTELNVAAMAAGLGSQWLIDVEKAFEAKYANTSFKDGKMGVDVVLTQPTSGISTIFDGMANNAQHIVFTEQGYRVSNYIDAGRFYPITDLVKDTTRVGGSLEDAMFDKYKEIFKKGDDYYALPHAEFYGGLSYNHDVFLEHNALFADDSCAESSKIEFEGKYNTGKPVYFVNSADIGNEGVVLSAGPDGDLTTEEDNGLPCSVEEFMILLDYFTGKVDAPIVLSGQWRNMVNYFICGMWASLAGQDQMESYYSLNGKIEVITEFSSENLIDGIDYVKKPKTTEWVDITPANAYLGNSMAAKYYAYAIAEMIQKEGYYLDINSNVDHLGAQKMLIYSSSEAVRNTAKTKQTAMLMDGSYWINETTDGSNFDTYYTLGGKGRPDVRHMALPTSITTADAEQKITDNKAAPSTLMDINYGCCVVNANIKGNQEIINAAMEFLKFFYSEEQIKAYTKSSRQFIALSYDLSDAEISELDPFYQKLWKLRDNTNGSNIVYPAPVAEKIPEDNYADTMRTYKKAIPSIYTYLQSANLGTTTPLTTNAYTLFDRTDNTLNGTTYKYGSQYIYEQSKITQQAWHAIYNVAV